MFCMSLMTRGALIASGFNASCTIMMITRMILTSFRAHSKIGISEVVYNNQLRSHY